MMQGKCGWDQANEKVSEVIWDKMVVSWIEVAQE